MNCNDKYSMNGENIGTPEEIAIINNNNVEYDGPS